MTGQCVGGRVNDMRVVAAAVTGPLHAMLMGATKPEDRGPSRPGCHNHLLVTTPAQSTPAQSKLTRPGR